MIIIRMPEFKTWYKSVPGGEAHGEWQLDVLEVIEALMWIWSATHWWLEQTHGLESKKKKKKTWKKGKKNGHALRHFNKQHMFLWGGYSTLDRWVPRGANTSRKTLTTSCQLLSGESLWVLWVALNPNTCQCLWFEPGQMLTKGFREAFLYLKRSKPHK